MEALMSARISPPHPPYPQSIQDCLTKIMPPGMSPLVLFTTLARDARLFERFMAGNLLDVGNLDLHSREIVIDRVAALAHSEYEWGVHVALFAKRATLSPDQISATVHGSAEDPCWSEPESALISACDQLHATCDLDDKTWSKLKSHFSDEAILEILMLCGLYRLVACLTNALRLPLEPFARRSPHESPALSP
jgi:alkylhydroperoxidase family enzyme